MRGKVSIISSTPNKSAVEMCKEILAAVERGDIKQICVSYVTKDGGISGDFSAGNSHVLMWAALSHCEREFYKTFIAENG